LSGRRAVSLSDEDRASVDAAYNARDAPQSRPAAASPQYRATDFFPEAFVVHEAGLEVAHDLFSIARAAPKVVAEASWRSLQASAAISCP
jgi:hypothetical protein